MKPVFQERDDDCFRANLASLLECDLSYVPDFMDKKGRFFTPECVAVMDDWMKSKGIAVLRFPLLFDRPADAMEWLWMRQPDVHVILAGLTKKGVEHSWIVRKGVVVHDPSPVPQPIYEAFDYETGQGEGKLFYAFFLVTPS